jgi:hypothetical protein
MQARYIDSLSNKDMDFNFNTFTQHFANFPEHLVYLMAGVIVLYGGIIMHYNQDMEEI